MHETLSQYSPKELARWRVHSIAFAVLAFSIGAAAFFGLDVLVRVSDRIRTPQDPHELSYAVAQTVGMHLNVALP